VECCDGKEAGRLLASDAEWQATQPHLPSGRRGARRVDDRQVILGIMHMLRSGGSWKDCSSASGPYTTIYNRWCPSSEHLALMAA
jgi:transposase